MKTVFYPIVFALALVFTSCIEDVTTEGPSRVDGYSDPASLQFSEAEMAVLSAELTVSDQIALQSTIIPDHLRGLDAPASIEQSSSAARKALLGRVLFYDSRLSATGETSCSSCHLQEAAFSDNKAFSDGINGGVTRRNSIALGSVPTFAPAVSGYGSSGDETFAAVEGRVRFFWDERAGTVKEQSEATIQDPIEMGKDLHALSDELRNIEMYRILSVKAFGTPDLTPDRITLALERFTSSITSMNTRFDEFAEAERFGVNLGEFTPEEIRGRELFNQNCATCHSSNFGEPHVTVANNGLDEVYEDKGLGALSGLRHKNGVFKVPFLRNVAITGPYMHDGRFETLREVIDHYSEGIADHPNLHFQLRAGTEPMRMNFSENDKQALIAFLEMATDETVLTAEEFSNPFRQ